MTFSGILSTLVLIGIAWEFLAGYIKDVKAEAKREAISEMEGRK